MVKGPGWITAIDVLGEDVDGVSGARLAAFQGVVKQNSASSPYLVANEFVAGRLALCLGLPVPGGDVLRLNGSVAYVSLRVGDEEPPGIVPSDFVGDNKELASMLVAFDCWVANDDRHQRNLAYVRGTWSPVIFDHDRAILGPDGDGFEGVERLARLAARPVLNGCIVDDVKRVKNVRDLLSNAAARIRGVATQALPGICDAAEGHGLFDKDVRDEVERFLKIRADSLVKLLEALGLPGQMKLG